MYCEKCNKPLPDDSVFCLYCGGKATEEPKQNICEQCGNEIPEDSEFCPFCGFLLKKVAETNKSDDEKRLDNAKPIETRGKSKAPDFMFVAEKPKKKLKFNKFVAIIIVLSLIIAGLATLNIIQFIDQKEVKDYNHKLSQKLDEKEYEVQNYKDLYDEEKERADNLFDESYFFYSTIAFIYDSDKKYYHSHNCDMHEDELYFRAYNVTAAKNLGYKPCPECHPFG